MDEAVYLLNECQPTGWPQWHLGTSPNGLTTEEMHLYLFEPSEFGLGLARATPACQFVAGAEFVGPRRTGAAPLTAMCEHCIKVRRAQAGLSDA